MATAKTWNILPDIILNLPPLLKNPNPDPDPDPDPGPDPDPDPNKELDFKEDSAVLGRTVDSFLFI
jgi:hypothetical protein